jgi:hypothetical protein
MWKALANDVKSPYRQEAATAQEAFKRQHQNYAYRRRTKKRVLLNRNPEKSAQSEIPGLPTDLFFRMTMESGPDPYRLFREWEAGRKVEQQETGIPNIGMVGQDTDTSDCLGDIQQCPNI